MKLAILFFLLFASYISSTNATNNTLMIKIDPSHYKSMLLFWDNNGVKTDCLLFDNDFGLKDIERRIYKSIVGNRDNIGEKLYVDLDIYIYNHNCNHTNLNDLNTLCEDNYNEYFGNFDFDMVNSSNYNSVKTVRHGIILSAYFHRINYITCNYQLTKDLDKIKYKNMYDVEKDYPVFEALDKHKILPYYEINLPRKVVHNNNNNKKDEADVIFLIFFGTIFGSLILFFILQNCNSVKEYPEKEE